MPTVIINGQPQSPYVRTARMCCIEAGVEHVLRPLGESFPEVKAALASDEYRRKHPFGRMPSLEDGDLVIFETSAIGRYVSGRYGGGRLVPEDPREAVRMEQWISAANCYVIPDSVRLFVAPQIFSDSPDMDAIEKSKPVLRSHFSILDRALERRTYFAGNSVSIADLLLAPPLHAVGTLPGGMELYEGLENLGRWWSQVSARASFTETEAPPFEKAA